MKGQEGCPEWNGLWHKIPILSREAIECAVGVGEQCSMKIRLEIFCRYLNLGILWIHEWNSYKHTRVENVFIDSLILFLIEL